jgi:hypothetical protein
MACRRSGVRIPLAPQFFRLLFECKVPSQVPKCSRLPRCPRLAVFVVVEDVVHYRRSPADRGHDHVAVDGLGDVGGLRSSPGRRPRVIEMTNSAWSLPSASSLSSRRSCARHVRHVVSLGSADTSVTVASGCGLFPHASSPVSVAAWVAPCGPLLALTTLTKPAAWPPTALSTLFAYACVMARDGRPGWPLGKSMSSTTFRAMRSGDLCSADRSAKRAVDHHESH